MGQVLTYEITEEDRVEIEDIEAMATLLRQLHRGGGLQSVTLSVEASESLLTHLLDSDQQAEIAQFAQPEHSHETADVPSESGSTTDRPETEAASPEDPEEETDEMTEDLDVRTEETDEIVDEADEFADEAAEILEEEGSLAESTTLNPDTRRWRIASFLYHAPDSYTTREITEAVEEELTSSTESAISSTVYEMHRDDLLDRDGSPYQYELTEEAADFFEKRAEEENVDIKDFTDAVQDQEGDQGDETEDTDQENTEE